MSKNEITGDALRTKPTTDAYADGWDRIFGKEPSLATEMQELNSKRMALCQEMKDYGVFDSPLEAWWRENEAKYLADSLHMSDFHMASVVWDAAIKAEREACAKLCEEVIEFPPGHGGQWEGHGVVRSQRSGVDCADAIRKRSN